MTYDLGPSVNSNEWEWLMLALTSPAYETNGEISQMGDDSL